MRNQSPNIFQGSPISVKNSPKYIFKPKGSSIIDTTPCNSISKKPNHVLVPFVFIPAKIEFHVTLPNPGPGVNKSHSPGQGNWKMKPGPENFQTRNFSRYFYNSLPITRPHFCDQRNQPITAGKSVDSVLQFRGPYLVALQFCSLLVF